jgi:antirestriction protein ArdC
MPTVYEVITSRIVDKLEAGTVPWHKPWSVETGAPRNLTSRRPYRGIVVFLLGCQSYASPFWGTYKRLLNTVAFRRPRTALYGPSTRP